MKFGQWLGFVAILISLYILWEIRQLLLLLFVAVVFATALNSIAKQFQKRLPLNRTVAILITLCLTVLFNVLFIWLVVPQFLEQSQRMIELLPQVFVALRVWLRSLETWLPLWLPQPPSLAELIVQLQPFVLQSVTNFLDFFSNSFRIALQLLFVLVLTLMLLANPREYQEAFVRLFPSFYRRRAKEILAECEIGLGNWFAGIAINCIFIGSLSGIGLWILQVDLVLVHALMAGLFNFIPNIGPTISAVFPLMIALLDAPWKALAVLIWYILIQQIESYWLTPTVMAKQVSLLPAVTLVAQIFFASVFGVLGLLLALPLTVVAQIWIQELYFKDIMDKWKNHPY
ncbi:AI-2E family transporter [Laspinema olomoucense]|uniref:AI-2E family transporter n=1 Tax=Laspinema olomoucense D3b TaxID=2953688 RepID=A0ABT2NCQ2_9CYAN|nr:MULTISPECIES: AI-2E family transporter [unclassified Laspinema]MCT7973483.1 AI-2E family transporter [Laspinema sp. D3d]MCT7980468.1 AI-2E family transporter [Laspinema sp. D3b]MCT7988823.1 AI-2E family transporter [Laspinema sp. D3a]MCT7995924.1 AI-2E family transporter [Laspinema sp. D3c]